MTGMEGLVTTRMEHCLGLNNCPSHTDDGDNYQVKAPSSSDTSDPGKDICSLQVIHTFPIGEFTSLLKCTCHPQIGTFMGQSRVRDAGVA